MNRLFVLIGIVAIVLLGGIFVLTQPSKSDVRREGYLSVSSLPTDQIVTLSDQVLGKTPIDKFALNEGEYLLKIGEAWKEKITISPNRETIIWRQVTRAESFASGFSLNHEPIKTFLGSRHQLQVVTSPSRGKVTIDDKELGVSPIETSDITTGKHQLIVSKDGYAPEVFEFEIFDDTSTTIKVDLKPNLLNTLQKLELGLNDLSPESERFPIKKRLEWGGSYEKIKENKVSLVKWTKLEAWGAEFEESFTPDFLLGLDSYVNDSQGLPGVPFAYIIDQNGQIYEGLGLLDYDYSKLNSFSYQAGTLPVLVLSRDTNFLNEKTKKSLSFLRDYLNNPPASEAKVLSQLDLQEFNFGERRDMKLQWQNTSSLVWQKGTGSEVWLNLTPGVTKSVFYDPETWKDPTTITAFSENEVYPGEIATFEFRVRAPYYPIEVEEEVVLKSLYNNELIADAKQDIKIKVIGEATNVLEILSTPTGFLNVRAGPSTATPLLTAIYPGDKFAYLREENKWIEIILQDGTKGWITNEYVKKS
jgi:hypothetical protein